MKFVLDTSAYSAFNRGDVRFRRWFNLKNDIVLPLIVVGELRAGFAAGDKRQVNEQLLRKFLDAPNVITTTISDMTTSLFADIYLQLRQNRTPISTNDLWISATALEHSVPLLTIDSDFSRVSGLNLVEI